MRRGRLLGTRPARAVMRVGVVLGMCATSRVGEQTYMEPVVGGDDPTIGTF